jgi:cation diffusion facilitator family transporter
MSSQSETTRSILYSLGANVAVALAKFGGALYTGSGALLAEAFHSIADSGNEALLLWGRKQAKRPPSAVHPLGHGRATYFWSFVVALLLFSFGGVASIYDGYRKLVLHAPLQLPWLAVGIILFAATAEAISLYVALKQINKLRGARNLWRWFRETRRSELIVVFSENAAALTGLAIALAAVLFTLFTGNPIYDAAGSIAVGVLLVAVSLAIAAEIKSLLIGESAAPTVRLAIKAFLSSRPEIEEVSSLITLQQGEDVLVAVKARMRTVATSREIVDAVDACQSGLRAAFPQVRWIFITPGL